MENIAIEIIKGLPTFQDIELKIVDALKYDSRQLKPQDRTQAKEEKAKEVLSLCEVLRQRFRIGATTEYLNFLLQSYTTTAYQQGRTIINRWLKVVGKSYKTLPTSNTYKTYRKLIGYRLQDRHTQEKEDLSDFESVPFSFVSVPFQKRFHVI